MLPPAIALPLGGVSRAEDGTRTRDPNLGKVVLYQLSYFRIAAERGRPLIGFAGANVVRLFELTKCFYAFLSFRLAQPPRRARERIDAPAL